MRTAYRFLTTAIAVGAIFPIGSLPAQAEEAPVSVETSSWFWSAQTTGQTVEGAPVPSVPLGASGVKEGQLAVAYKGETDENKEAVSDKETFLAWDIYFIPEGSYVDSFTFTMTLDPSAEQLFVKEEITPPAAAPTHGGQPPLIACFPTIGFGQGEGEAFSQKPDLDCTDPVVGGYDEATKSYTFDATVLAQDWVDRVKEPNWGLGIRPATDEDDPFQLVFLGAKDVKATIAYTPAEPETPVVPVQPEVVLPPVPPTDTSVFVPDTQPVPQPQPQVQPQAPVVAQPPVVRVQPVAATPLKASRGFTPVFWFAMIGGVLLIGTASMILGDPVEAAGRSRNRISPNGRHRLNVPAGATARVNPSAQPRIV